MTEADAQKQAKLITDEEKRAQEIKEIPGEFTKFVNGWAENVVKTQGEVAYKVALKAANVKTIANKDFRIKAIQVGKAALTMVPVAAAAVAAVFTAPIAIPALLICGGIGIAIGGVTGLAKIGKSIKDTWDIEKRILGKARDDVEAIKAAFEGAKNKNLNLAKHMLELNILIKTYENDYKTLKTEAAKWGSEWDVINAAANKLASLDSFPTAQTMKKRSGEAQAALKKIDSELDELKTKIGVSQAVVKELEALGVEMEKVARYSPESVLSQIRTAEKFDVVTTITGNVSTALGIVGQSWG